MSPTDTLATLIQVLAVGGVCFFIGRFLGLVLVGFFELLKAIWGRVVKLTKLPFEWVRRKRKDLELSRLMRETEQADARRRLRRRTEDLLEYPRHRTLPLRVITNPMIQ